MFLFKRKTVVVDCFTNIGAVASEYPIKKSFYYVADWWKNLDACFYEKTKFDITIPAPTMKTCHGFINLYQKSWMVPLWSDFIIKTQSTGEWGFVSPNDLTSKIPYMLVNHSPEQYKGAFKNFIHLKLVAPWLISEKKGINFIMTGADWSLIDDFPNIRVLTGILNFKRPSNANINFFVPKADLLHTLSAGTPMMHLIPMTDKKVELKIHVVSEEEYKLQESKSWSFQNKFIKKYTK